MTAIIIQQQGESMQTITIVKDGSTRIIIIKDGEVLSTDPKDIALCKSLVS
jgi:hypothetical protein